MRRIHLRTRRRQIQGSLHRAAKSIDDKPKRGSFLDLKRANSVGAKRGRGDKQ